MKIPVALTMLASPFSLPHNERWILPIALGFFTLLTVYFTWRLKTDEGDKWLFRKKMKVSVLFWLACEVLWQFHGADSTFPVGPITGILFLYLTSQALVYGIYCLIKRRKQQPRCKRLSHQNSARGREKRAGKGSDPVLPA